MVFAAFGAVVKGDSGGDVDEAGVPLPDDGADVFGVQAAGDPGAAMFGGGGDEAGVEGAAGSAVFAWGEGVDEDGGGGIGGEGAGVVFGFEAEGFESGPEFEGFGGFIAVELDEIQASFAQEFSDGRRQEVT